MKAIERHPPDQSRPVDAEDDHEAMNVLLTAVSADFLDRYQDVTKLPLFRGGPYWTAKHGPFIDQRDYFDFAVVLCEKADTVSESRALTRLLNARRIAALMLVPESIGHLLGDTCDCLIVTSSGGTPPVHNLAYAILAPLQQDQLVCCDWADVLSILSDGARGRLLYVEAPDTAAAGKLLTERIRGLGNDRHYGAIASLHHNVSRGLRDWHPLLNTMKSLMRQDAGLIVGAPISNDRSSRAAALVLTAPSFRYFRNQQSSPSPRVDVASPPDPSEIPAFLRPRKP